MFPRKPLPVSGPVPAVFGGRTGPINGEAGFTLEAIPPSGDDRVRLVSSDPIWGGVWAAQVSLGAVSRLNGWLTNRGFGTAFAISDRHLLTAAHVLWRPSRRIVIKSRRIDIARYDDEGVATIPKVGPGSTIALEFASDPQADLALIRLPNSGACDTSLPLQAEIDFAALRGKRVTVAGYPQAAGRGETSFRCMSAEGEVVGLAGGEIYYRNLATTVGQSGSPIILQDTGQVIGVHTGSDARAFGEKRLNRGAALTAARRKEIETWLKN